MEANIDSVDQLEILRVLGEDPNRQWRAADLAGEVQTPPPAIGTHLAALHARGLLIVQMRETESYCRYGPRNAETADKLAQLLQVYRERPVSMIKHVYARARDPLKSFAEAFRLKKES